MNLYGFTNEQAVKINQGKDSLVGYVRRLKTFYASQDAIKQFCEDKSVERDDDAIFRGKPAIIFWKKMNKLTKHRERNISHLLFLIPILKGTSVVKKSV